MDTGNVHDLTAAYALDSLEADEARAYEAHLDRCESCRAALAELSNTAAALAWASETPPPPGRLRSAILSQAAAERRNVVPLTVRRSPLFRATAAVAAVAACAAVAFGVWAASLSRSLSHERASRGADARAVEILSDPASRRSSLADGRGVLAIDPTGEGVLVVRQLPAVPAGKTYEAWVIPRGGDPRPAGLFRGGSPTTIVRLTGSVPRGAVVAATVERAGGARAPTRSPIFSAQA
jgi:anti-sigma-K factor RskA